MLKHQTITFLEKYLSSSFSFAHFRIMHFQTWCYEIEQNENYSTNLTIIKCGLNQKQSPEMFYKKDIPKKFAKFTGKHTCAKVSFLIKLQESTATLLKKRLWHRCFPVNFAKCLRTPFLQNITGRLLLLNENSVDHW